eukprot:2190537-Pyramimonas_sp.AAC.1
MRDRSGARCASRARAQGPNVALASAPRAFVARHFVERLGPPGASQGLLEHPGASRGFPRALWILLPGIPRGFLTPAKASWSLMDAPGAS